MLLSCLDLLRTTLQFQVAAKRCYAAGPDPCNVLGVSALARVATHPKQKVWSNSEVGQGNPKLCFSVFLISQKKTMLQRTPPFLSKSRQRFSRLYPFYFWLHPLTTFLLLLCSTASNAAAALASILRQQALEVSVPTGEMRMHKNPFNHREVRMECIQILSTKRSRKTNMEPDTVLLVPEPSIFYLLWLQGGGHLLLPLRRCRTPKEVPSIHHFNKVEMSKCSSLYIIHCI